MGGYLLAMGSSKKVVSGVIWSTITNIVNAIYGFVAVPVLINYFGKAEYGLIGLAMSINVYMRLMDMGFENTNVRFYSTWMAQNDKNHLLKSFQTSISFYGFIGLANASLLIIIASFSQHIFNVTPGQDAILKRLFYILSFSTFCTWLMSCLDQMIKASENVAWVKKCTLLSKIFMIFVLSVTVWAHLSIEAYFALSCLATFILMPLYVGKIKSQVPYISFFPRWNQDVFKEMLPYTLNIFSFSLFQFSFYNLRPVFLGMQGTMESVADYRILNGMVSIVTMLGGAFTSILLPTTSKVVALRDKDAYKRIAYDGTKYISIILCFCCFGMMSVGGELLTLYVGKEYLHLLPWLCLWLMCTLGAHNQALSSLILAGADIRAITYSSIISSAVGLLTAWFLIPYYEVGGVCIAFAIYMIIQIGFYYTFYWPVKMKIDSQKILFKSFLPYVGLGLMLYYLTGLLRLEMNTFWTFFSKGAVFSICYVIVVGFLINKTKKIYKESQNILLQELGILNWQPKHELSYVKNFSDVNSANRCDAEYFQPKYDEIIEKIKSYPNGWDKLANITKEPKKGIEVGSEEYCEKGIPFIRVSNLSQYEINDNNMQYISEQYYNSVANIYQPKKGEILLSKDGTPGIAYFLNETPQKMIPSGGILRLSVDNDEYLPEYLTLTLNSIVVQMQVERVSSGALIKHWLVDEIQNTLIPKLEMCKQIEIVEQLKEATKLRTQSKQLLEIAKRVVEIAIEENEEIATSWINEQLSKIGVTI